MHLRKTSPPWPHPDARTVWVLSVIVACIDIAYHFLDAEEPVNTLMDDLQRLKIAIRQDIALEL